MLNASGFCDIVGGTADHGQSVAISASVLESIGRHGCFAKPSSFAYYAMRTLKLGFSFKQTFGPVCVYGCKVQEFWGVSVDTARVVAAVVCAYSDMLVSYCDSRSLGFGVLTIIRIDEVCLSTLFVLGVNGLVFYSCGASGFLPDLLEHYNSRAYASSCVSFLSDSEINVHCSMYNNLYRRYRYTNVIRNLLFVFIRIGWFYRMPSDGGVFSVIASFL